MTVKVAINGFGRIGRNILRAIVESGRTDIEVIAINDLGPVETNAHLLRFDSVHGRFPATVGAFEIPPFDHSTKALARTAADMTRAGLAISVAGGGDTVAALNMAGAADDFTYVSTAGGAFLEWLEGKELPGLAALTRAKAA